MKNRKGLHMFRNSNGSIIIYKLYDTVILSFIDDTIVINSGGWKTRHTKNCINDNLPEGYKVFQKDFDWFVNLPSGETIEFKDNLTLEVK